MSSHCWTRLRLVVEEGACVLRGGKKMSRQDRVKPCRFTDAACLLSANILYRISATETLCFNLPVRRRARPAEEPRRSSQPLSCQRAVALPAGARHRSKSEQRLCNFKVPFVAETRIF